MENQKSNRGVRPSNDISKELKAKSSYKYAFLTINCFRISESKNNQKIFTLRGNSSPKMFRPSEEKENTPLPNLDQNEDITSNKIGYSTSFFPQNIYHSAESFEQKLFKSFDSQNIFKNQNSNEKHNL